MYLPQSASSLGTNWSGRQRGDDIHDDSLDKGVGMSPPGLGSEQSPTDREGEK